MRPKEAYILKRFDDPILSFRLRDDGYGDAAELLEVFDYNRLPIPLKMSLYDAKANASQRLERWLVKRFSIGQRRNAVLFLDKFGVKSVYELRKLLDISLGLSINDTLWIVKESFARKFEDYNLYGRPFIDEGLSRLLLGAGGDCAAPERRPYPSPEFTTKGATPKCWRMENGVMRLYKAGLPGKYTEPCSEALASQLASFLGLPHADYYLDKRDDVLCSVCTLFTDMKTSYIPFADIIEGRSEDVRDVLALAKRLPKRVGDAIADMLIFDALIGNPDRHFNNFGILADSGTDRVIGPAPLYDHGFALLHNIADAEMRGASASVTGDEFMPVPATYADFFRAAFAEPRHTEMLEKARRFSFTQPAVRISSERLRFLNVWVIRRAEKLLREIRREKALSPLMPSWVREF